jgi:nucleoside-diphosphate-sugar epimerase
MLYDESETRGVYRSAMVRFAEALVKGREIVVHQGARRSWMHMSDAVRVIEKLMYVPRYHRYHRVNIGNPKVVSVLSLAQLMCDKLRIGYDLITETDLPSRMTLQKIPDLTRQGELTGMDYFIGIGEGVDRLLARLRTEKLRGEL